MIQNIETTLTELKMAWEFQQKARFLAMALTSIGGSTDTVALRMLGERALQLVAEGKQQGFAVDWVPTVIAIVERGEVPTLYGSFESKSSAR